MLEYIEVSGFKSLYNFRMKVRPGLNILVGPNGAGKTNIVSFFEFLSLLSATTLNDAILKAGGTGSVFKRYRNSDSGREIRFSVKGTTEPGVSEPTYLNQKKIHYRYSACIKFDVEEGRLFYSSQKVNIAIAGAKNNFKKYKSTRDNIWDLELTSTSDGLGQSRVKVTKIVVARVSPRFFYSAGPTKSSKLQLVDAISARLSDPSLDRTSLLSTVIENFHNVRVENEISFGTAFNIVPSIVKRAEDIAMAPGVNPDGSGLGATLMYLNRRTNERQPARPKYFLSRYRIDPQTRLRRNASLEEIVKFTRLANDSILGVRVETDSFDGRIRIICEINDTDGKIDVPFQNMSDGTAKWMALIAAITANSTLFAVEEPENYLHPTMQMEIVKIVRESVERSSKKSFALITTHSETLLNAARPEEVVVVSMHQGSTVAREVRDANELNQLISDTGFGLGWYYTTGALE